MESRRSIAIFGDQVATDLIKVSTDARDLDNSGWWAVTQTFEGSFLAFQFNTVLPLSEVKLESGLPPQVPIGNWKPSLNQAEYEEAVRSIKDDISRGWVYQANLCYVLSAELEETFDPVALWQLLKLHNPAPYLSALWVPKNESGLIHDVAIASASPELFLARDGYELISSPIKGTAKTIDDLLEKDRAENVMIVDLIRNDLAQISMPGTVEVPELLRPEHHPGLVHLVSDVRGLVSETTSWHEILNAMSPPGSVSGAPKSSALEVIGRLERSARGIYCGAFGFVDANVKLAKLAVGIRTFWQSEKDSKKFLNFGTGAGITWGSDPTNEWHETQLKAAHLLNVASMELS